MGARKSALILISACLLAPTAQGGGVEFEPMIEISAGYQYESIPGNLTGEERDESRSGARIQVLIEALRLSFKRADGEEGASVSFIPLAVELEPSIENLHGDAFGGLERDGDFKHMIRRVTGALVDARYDFLDGRLFVRGKLATVEYDRDRGFWDWRAIDAEVGATHVWEPGGGDLIVNLEIRAGTGAGGIHLNALDRIREAIGTGAGASDAMIVSPHLTASAGFDFDAFRLTWTGDAEYRVDVTSDRAGPTADSLKVMTSLEAAFRVTPWNFATQFEVFAAARYELDTLTARGMFFESSDPFHALFVGVGLRGTF